MTAPRPDDGDQIALDDSATSRPGVIRCSDAERERTGARLHAAAGEGRLSIQETDDRLASTFAARYRHELDAITADLPDPDATAGWGAVARLALQQLLDDAALLLGRHGRGPRRRKLVLVLVLGVVAALMMAAVMVVLALHGVAVGGEHHYFDHG